MMAERVNPVGKLMWDIQHRNSGGVGPVGIGVVKKSWSEADVFEVADGETVPKMFLKKDILLFRLILYSCKFFERYCSISFPGVAVFLPAPGGFREFLPVFSSFLKLMLIFEGLSPGLPL